MSRLIVFSDAALETLWSTKNNIANNWGSKQADKFLKRVDKVLALTAALLRGGSAPTCQGAT